MIEELASDVFLEKASDGEFVVSVGKFGALKLEDAQQLAVAISKEAKKAKTAKAREEKKAKAEKSKEEIVVQQTQFSDKREPLMDVYEVARLFRTTPLGIRASLHRGRFPVEPVSRGQGRALLWRPKDVDAYFQCATPQAIGDLRGRNKAKAKHGVVP